MWKIAEWLVAALLLGKKEAKVAAKAMVLFFLFGFFERKNKKFKYSFHARAKI